MRAIVATVTAVLALAVSSCTKPAEPTISLDRAVQIGDVDQIQRHIYWESDLNQPNVQGDPPLHVVARAGRVAIAHSLAVNGADLEGLNRSGQRPLQVALAHGRTQVAMTLVNLGAHLDAQSALASLVSADTLDRDSLTFLVRAGARLDHTNASGDAPLHVAIRAGHLNAVRRLILAGADVNQPDGVGALPLQIARESPVGPDARFIVSTLERNGARTAPTE
jgi:ankyrin repeat protein